MYTVACLGTELMRLSVPASDIVLAFQPPEARKYTEFAAV
ncbi:element excision factor XisI family protein [Calothrix sp. PCC 7507]